jgi:thiol-disulfide isomerase/thioredoxin
VTLNRKNRQRRTLLERTSFHAILMLAIVPSLTLPGCGPSEPSEISAATSGYVPADKAKPSGSTSAPDDSASNASAAPASRESKVEAGPPGMTTAPAVPMFEPGKVDPKIASKEYMTLKLGELKDSVSLVQFLEKSTRAVRELVADGRRNLMTKELLLERGMDLSRMKLQAAESLGKIAATSDEKAAASLGKIESLSQMASFGDVASTDDLRSLVAVEVNNSDPRVSQQAKSIALSLLSVDYENGSAKSTELISQIEALLAGGKDLSASNLGAIAQALANLDKHSETEAALRLAQKTEETFRDNDEPQMALSAWELHASRTTEIKDIQSLLAPGSADLKDPVRSKQVINALMTKIPSPWTSFFLLQIAMNIEYSGQPLVAKEMIDVAQTQIKNLKNAEARAELTQNCEQFQRRLGILNNVMDMTSLVDLDGKPIDMERYKGKVVLVDFWASWCGPCIQEIPNIEKVYSSKNPEGFEVIGINIDENRADLDSFLQSRKLAWTTYVSSSTNPDEKGFNAPAAKTIGISAIPFIAIIGKDGKVADIHVRGPKLESKVAELLAKE